MKARCRFFPNCMCKWQQADSWTRQETQTDVRLSESCSEAEKGKERKWESWYWRKSWMSDTELVNLPRAVFQCSIAAWQLERKRSAHPSQKYAWSEERRKSFFKQKMSENKTEVNWTRWQPCYFFSCYLISELRTSVLLSKLKWSS